MVVRGKDSWEQCRKDTQLDHKGKKKNSDVVGGINVQFSLCSLPPVEDITECSFSSGMKMQQHVLNVYAQGSPLDTYNVTFSVATGHIHTIYVVCTRIQDSQKESRSLA